MTLLILNPTSDVEFMRHVESLASTCSTSAELEAALNGAYPDAVVRVRVLSGDREAWYVYRDGTWVASAPSARR